MQIDISSSTLTLSPSSVLAVQEGAGTRVLCRTGCLWVTQEGEVKDSVVRAGEVLTIHRPGRTVISALETSTLLLLGPEVRDVTVQRHRLRTPRLAAEVASCN
ncbi:MAG: DUF2917 domain-containing protein [Betaproteobacteria bacterium]